MRFVRILLRRCTVCDMFTCFVVYVRLRAFGCFMGLCVLFETYRVMLSGVFVCGVLFFVCSCCMVCVLRVCLNALASAIMCLCVLIVIYCVMVYTSFWGVFCLCLCVRVCVLI